MTYSIEQLKEYYNSKEAPLGIYDYYRVLPEIIAELEARDQEIASLKDGRAIFLRTAREVTARECVEIAEMFGEEYSGLIARKIREKFGVSK